MRSKSHPLTLLLALVAAFALFLGACSDDDDGGIDEPEETTTSEAAADDPDAFAAEVDALCETNDEESDQLNEDLSAALDDVDTALQEGDEEAAAEAADEAIAVFEQGVESNEQYIEDVEALGVPDEFRETIDGVIELLEEQNDIIADGVAALEERDYDAFIEVGNQIAAEEEETDERSQELADELGSENCGPDDEDDVDGDDSGSEDEDEAESDNADAGSDDELDTFDPSNP
jgi:hypothetical protein